MPNKKLTPKRTLFQKIKEEAKNLRKKAREEKQFIDRNFQILDESDFQGYSSDEDVFDNVPEKTNIEGSDAKELCDTPSTTKDLSSSALTEFLTPSPESKYVSDNENDSPIDLMVCSI